MAVVIRLQRAGGRNRPFFRMVVADSRRARDGAFIEKLGYYDPIPDPDVISIDRARVDRWVAQGAQPSVAVRELVRRFDRRQAAGGAEPPPPAGARSRAAAGPAAPASAAAPAE
ncbi:MAG: 30S ribosomal protein S16 [Candidatus Eisenbacteria bacterium]|uniref:Small ribosomal subunit protein bS16 n=1 Tax=Eiseniibacteriota bacterium TaxID=2212470 RepID=A0A937XAA3_UNCEI|nr:30S ribosomal protein S16 [Candidatus Eisenbacteria bacterium]